MTDTLTIPSPNAEQRCVAAAQYERAHEVLNKNDFDYAIQLLLNCCKIDPGNPIYRKTLRGTQKAKYKNNMKGSRFASVTTASLKLRLKTALHAEDYLRVLELGEEILVSNPWDVGTQMAIAKALAVFGIYDLAVWSLEQAYQKAPNDLKVQKALARMYEKEGNFTNANALWALIRNAHPRDEEAQKKVNDLAANETISKGQYEAVLQTDTHHLEDTKESRPLRFAPQPEARAAGGQAKINRQIEELSKKIEADPRDAGHYLQLARLYRKRKKWDKVCSVLETGLQAAGNHFELAIELADANIEPVRANLAAVEAKCAAHSDDQQLQHLRVQLLKEINSREQDLYRQKADRYPTDMSYRLELGKRLLQNGQIDEAIQELQTARTDPRIHWKALMYLGFCFKTRRNWRLAQRNFEDALRNLPAGETSKRKEILHQLATGCADSGDVSAALEWAYELANEDFGYKNIGTLIDQWQTQLQGGAI